MSARAPDGGHMLSLSLSAMLLIDQSLGELLLA